MNIAMNTTTTNRQTLDGLCNSKPGTFKQFVRTKEALLLALENERKARIRASREAASKLAWAA